MCWWICLSMVKMHQTVIQNTQIIIIIITKHQTWMDKLCNFYYLNNQLFDKQKRMTSVNYDHINLVNRESWSIYWFYGLKCIIGWKKIYLLLSMVLGLNSRLMIIEKFGHLLKIKWKRDEIIFLKDIYKSICLRCTNCRTATSYLPLTLSFYIILYAVLHTDNNKLWSVNILLINNKTFVLLDDIKLNQNRANSLCKSFSS